MAKVTFKNPYRAVFQRDGRNEQLQYGKGETAELDPDLEDFIRRDAPGVMVRAKGTSTAARKKAAKKG